MVSPRRRRLFIALAYMDLCHLNQRGLERIAAEVAEEILRRGWLN